MRVTLSWNEGKDRIQRSYEAVIQQESRMITEFNAMNATGSEVEMQLTIESFINLDSKETNLHAETPFGLFRILKVAPFSEYGLVVTEMLGTKVKK